MLETPFYYLGLATAAVLFYKGARHIYIYAFHVSTLPKYIHGSDPWALVTGTTGEIGLEFASQLCDAGFNVIVSGRNESKLGKAVDVLKKRHPQRQLRTLVLDATTATPSDIDRAVEPLRALNLTVLVNNAGGVPGIWHNYDTLEDQPTNEIAGIVALNALFPTYLTRALLPTLKRNGPALVLNVSSEARAGLPYVCVYGGAKAYLDTLSAALDCESELEGKNVDVQSVVFAQVNNSNHDKPFDTAWNVPTAGAAARAALDRIGCGEPIKTAYWPHALQVVPLGWLSSFLTKKMKVGIMKGLKAEHVKNS